MPIEVPRVYLHDGAGRRIGQFSSARNIDRSYLLMEPASARLSIASNDSLITEIDPRLGRFVVIESEAYATPWVGKLTVPNGSKSSEEITLICRSMDAVLSQRFLNASYSGTGGAVFKSIIDAASASNPTGITSATNGVVIGPAYGVTLNDRSAFQALTQLARETGHEWWLEYAVSTTEIVAYAHYRPARGFDRCRQAALVSGGSGNAEWGDWKIDGEAHTFGLTVVGGVGSVTQAYSERPRQRSQSSTALGNAVKAPVGAVHGHSVQRTDGSSSALTRIERLRVSEALKSQGVVVSAAEALLSRPPLAEQSMTWKVLGDADWSLFDLGSIVRAVAPDAFISGFDGYVRIVAVQPREEAGELNLVVQIVEGADHA